MRLERLSIGMGDRFGRQGRAQLGALQRAAAAGADVVPVWNKSFREHSIIGSAPADVRREADAAVRSAGWNRPYAVDADHIGLKTVDGFVAACDFFTIDVADFIGEAVDAADVARFVERHARLVGELQVPGLPAPLAVTRDVLASAAERYLAAVRAAARIYRHIEAGKGRDGFIAEVSMDECRDPQTPLDLLLILSALADEGVPLQTIAPKFSGRFNKGVDYVGDVARFSREFDADLCVVAHAVQAFGLPSNLKLSVHSGSDKFSLYGPMRAALKRRGAGVHLKTAGTTWLAELTGLAQAGGEGLAIAREVYAGACARFDELCKPYASVIDIDRGRLPSPQAVSTWTPSAFAQALRHDPACPSFNPHLRQLLHVGYKVAAEMGARYLSALDRNAPTVGTEVERNLYEAHLRPLFVG